MRIRRQLALLAAAALAVTVVMVAGLVEVVRAEAAGLRQQTASQDIARDIGSLLTLTNEFAAYGGERAATQWRLRYGQLLATVNVAVQSGPQPSPHLLELRRSLGTLPQLFERLVEQSEAPPSALAGRRRDLLVERLLTEAQGIIEASHRWGYEVAADQADNQRWFGTVVLATPMIFLLLLGGMGAMVWRRVLQPLARIDAAVAGIRAGDLDTRCDVQARDELGDTARAVDSMARSLGEQTQALRASEERLRMITDSVPALIGYIDAEGRYAIVNRAYEAWHGVPREQLVGRPVRAFYGDGDFSPFESHLQRALAGETVEFDADLMRNGRPWSMRLNYQPHIDAHGRTLGVYVLGNDLTALRKSERQLRTLMESSPLGVFHADAAGRCLYVNPAWLGIAGLTLEESLGEGWVRVIHPAHREQIMASFKEAQTRGGVIVTEHRYVRPDGTEVWVRGHAVPLREGGQLSGFIGTVEDITSRRRLDAELQTRGEELQRSNAELEQFAYVASHDLQEPLRMIASYSQLILRRHRDALPPEAQEFMGFIEDGGRRAQALIADLLSLARVNSHGKPLEPVSLASVLKDVMRSLKVALQEGKPTLTWDEDLPTVRADRRQLSQLLQNLLTNALKFRGTEPLRIHVGAAREPDGRWRITVQDNGLGIEPKFHQRIFGMFQRLHLRDEHAGTGIGLAICKKVVERHGGRIGVESELGRGSTFWFTLEEAAAQGEVPP
ncbi:MAG TPA: PAS domain S-box protein [Roseateles sp.]